MKEAGRVGGTGTNSNILSRIYTLGDLGLTQIQAAQYQRESSVPPDVYEDWVRRVVARSDGVLTPTSLPDWRGDLTNPAGPMRRESLLPRAKAEFEDWLPNSGEKWPRRTGTRLAGLLDCASSRNVK